MTSWRIEQYRRALKQARHIEHFKDVASGVQ
jgi:hypothetical protein